MTRSKERLAPASLATAGGGEPAMLRASPQAGNGGSAHPVEHNSNP
jgi:hypothetical protein